MDQSLDQNTQLAIQLLYGMDVMKIDLSAAIQALATARQECQSCVAMALIGNQLRKTSNMFGSDSAFRDAFRHGLRKEAMNGHSTAQWALGVAFHFGLGVGRDVTAAKYWYERSASQRDALGQVSLGFSVGEAEPEAGALLYMLSAEQGNASGQFNLAVVLERGIGVPKNEELAAAWYEKSAIQGFDVAQNNLGVLYQYGRGVPQNFTEAIRLYRLSAEQGNGMAQTNLGHMYLAGEGVDRCSRTAREWFEKAAAQGISAARRLLNE